MLKCLTNEITLFIRNLLTLKDIPFFLLATFLCFPQNITTSKKMIMEKTDSKITQMISGPAIVSLLIIEQDGSDV